MTTPTNDPYVHEEHRVPGVYVRYRNLDGRRWEVYGQCVGTGVCEGTPELDGPVDVNQVYTPEMKPCPVCGLEFKDLPPCARRASWED